MSDRGEEAGRISVLMLGLTLVVIAVITVALTITALHTQRRALYGCADALTLSAAATLGADPYYQQASLAESEGQARKMVEDRLQQLVGSVCHVGQQVNLDGFSYQNDVVEVRLSTVPTLPVVSKYMSFLTEPLKISVASSANVTKSRNV